MAGRIVPDKNAAITTATAAGYITVGSTTGFYAGAHAYISKSGQPNKEVIITEVQSSTVMGVRFVDDIGAGPNYGRSDVSLYTTSGRIDMPSQLIYNPNDKPLD